VVRRVNMVCPYIISVRDSEECDMELDDNGVQTHYHKISMTIRVPMRCKKEECGAWHDGKCNFQKG
jgi:hypothetical protein